MRLINVNIANYVPIGILVICIITGLIICAKLKLDEKKKIKEANKPKPAPKKATLTMVQQYCTEKEMKILESLHQALPPDFIAFPKVGMVNLVAPNSTLVDFNKIIGKSVDILICLRDKMKPVLAIDLISLSPVEKQQKHMEECVLNALSAVKLNVLQIQMQEEYDLSLLRNQVYDALPAKVVLNLKDKIINK